MRQFFDRCHQYREQISLLAVEALADAERAAVENHLSTCAGCRRYRDEIRMVTGSLSRWEENIAGIHPGEAMLARWDKDFAAALKPQRLSSRAFTAHVFAWCKDMIRPYRRIWTGLAAIWAVLLVVNLSQRSPNHGATAKSTAPSPELVRAFLDGAGFLDHPIHAVEKNVERAPAPRSEGHSGPASNKSI